MRYCLNHIILVQGFCPLKIEITVLTFLMDSVSNCLKTIRELAEYSQTSFPAGSLSLRRGG